MTYVPLPNRLWNQIRSASLSIFMRSLVSKSSSALSLTCFIIPLYNFHAASKNASLAHDSSFVHVYLA